jgi:outer membrane protein assembly factor BamB
LTLVTSEGGSLYALRLADGTLKWKYETGDQLRCAPTVVGNRTFLAGCDGKLHVVDLDQGIGVGEGLPLEGPTGSTPSTQGDVVIAPTHAGSVLAFNWKEAKPLWAFVDAERSQEIQSSPAIHENTVFVATRNRRLLAIDSSNGSLLWEFAFRKRTDASPIVSDGRVWIGAADGRLYAIDQKSGKEVWLVEHTGAFNASGAIAEGKLVIASDKGSIYCYGSAE